MDNKIRFGIWIVIFSFIMPLGMVSSKELPDIIISNITWEPLNPSVGEKVVFTVTIENRGSADATFITRYGTPSMFYIYYYINFQYYGMDTVSSSTWPFLDPNKSITQRFEWIAQPGTLIIKAVADAKSCESERIDCVRESNENNNEKSVTFSNTLLPDLVVSNIQWNPQNPAVNEKVIFTVTTENKGAGNVKNFWVSYYINNKYIGSDSVKDILANGSVITTFEWNAQIGQHTIKVIADAKSCGQERRDCIPESDENNNELRINFSHTICDGIICKNICYTTKGKCCNDTWYEGENRCCTDKDCSKGYYCNNHICTGLKDTDGDGIFDNIDKCSQSFGPECNRGCPTNTDTDNDGLQEDNPYCPNYDPSKNDHDNDKIKSNKDCDDKNPQNILIKGDYDGDKIDNCEDKCPHKPGIKEYMGCPSPLIKSTTNISEVTIPQGYSRIIAIPLQLEGSERLYNVKCDVEGKIKEWIGEIPPFDIEKEKVIYLTINSPEDSLPAFHDGILNCKHNGKSVGQIPLKIKIPNIAIHLHSNKIFVGKDLKAGINGFVQNNEDYDISITITFALGSGAVISGAKGILDATYGTATTGRIDKVKSGDTRQVYFDIEITDKNVDYVNYKINVFVKDLRGNKFVGERKGTLKVEMIDSDNDQLPDWLEAQRGIDMFNPDTDKDGLSDKVELNLGTCPKIKDTDGDGHSDYEEKTVGANPLNKNETPDIIFFLKKKLSEPGGIITAIIILIIVGWILLRR